MHQMYAAYMPSLKVVSTTEFQREVMSRHQMKHSLLQETPINNMTLNKEANDIVTSNEETKENTVNST